MATFNPWVPGSSPGRTTPARWPDAPWASGYQPRSRGEQEAIGCATLRLCGRVVGCRKGQVGGGAVQFGEGQAGGSGYHGAATVLGYIEGPAIGGIIAMVRAPIPE